MQPLKTLQKGATIVSSRLGVNLQHSKIMG